LSSFREAGGSAVAVIPEMGKIPKINFKKLACFRRPKSTTQNTTIATHSTTNSPRFYHPKTPENRKTPCKNHPLPRQNIFLQNMT
jgi:hypothetical protein